jgi:putative oxidoreductase
MKSIAKRVPLPPVTASDLAATGGRLLIAAIFLLSGWSKLGDPAGTAAYIASVGLPLPEVGAYLAIIVELVGGAMLLFGYRTKLAATALALFTLVAAVFFHSALGDQNQFIHFFKNIAIVGGLLQVIAFGSGRLSLGRGA